MENLYDIEWHIHFAPGGFALRAKRGAKSCWCFNAGANIFTKWNPAHVVQSTHLLVKIHNTYFLNLKLEDTLCFLCKYLSNSKILLAPGECTGTSKCHLTPDSVTLCWHNFFVFFSLSVFDYFFSKVEKVEGILSQIMCEMMSSNVGQRTQKTEDELISGIIFKVVALLPEGTLLDYAKKLSRHVRQANENGGKVLSKAHSILGLILFM